MKKRRSHPIMLAQFVWRFLFLLILPVLRGAWAAATGGSLLDWLGGAWMDVLSLLSIFVLAFLQWWCLTYQLLPQGLSVESGVLFRRCFCIPRQRVTTLSVVRPFYLKPFGAVLLRADTLAGGVEQTDLSLTLSRRRAREIFEDRQLFLAREGWAKRELRPGKLSIAFLSAALSSSLAGVVFFSTFISQTGSLLGEEFSDRIYGTFERFTKAMAWGLPPATAALAYLLLFGWLFTFVRNLIRHIPFRICRDRDLLSIEGGCLTNRSYSVQVRDINFVDIRQTVLSRILGLHSAFIHAVGYGKAKDDVTAVIPACRWPQMMRQLQLVLPEFCLSPRQAKPNFGAWMRFVMDALWPCLLLPAATWFLISRFPDWADFTLFAGLMASVPAYWFLTVRLIDFSSSGLGRTGDCYTLRYSSGYSLHTVMLPREHVTFVYLRQSPIQKLDDRCDVKIYSSAENRRVHHIRNIDRKEAIAVLDIDWKDGAGPR
ncbi:MAG: PH domain-containing protein [Oscillospiraceae bacterium]|nr:PH domain-containing protein [Oscillospiraceae bacterium]